MGPNKQKGKWGVCVYAHECACLWILLKLTLYNKRNAISSHSPYCYSMFCPKTPSLHISLSPTLRKSWLGHQQNRTYIFGFQFYIIFPTERWALQEPHRASFTTKITHDVEGPWMANHATAMEAYCDSSITSPLCLIQIQLHNTRSFLLNGYLNYKPDISKGTGGEPQTVMEALSHSHCYLQC